MQTDINEAITFCRYLPAKEQGNIPYDAYIYYMNALADLQIRVKQEAELIHKAGKVTIA